MRAKTVQRVRGGRLLKGVNDEPFFIPPNDESVLEKNSTENHAQNKNMLDINLLRPEKGGDPVRFVATTFIPLSLLVVFVDVFLCSSSFRRRLRRAMMIGDDF